jgi:NADH:ubiquinone oxidoreductase subunit C
MNIDIILKCIFIFKKYIYKIYCLVGNEFFISLNLDCLTDCVFLLKNSLLFNISSLVDVFAVDWVWKQHRFSIFYNLYSFLYNYRLFLIIDVKVTSVCIFSVGVESLMHLFLSANWLEREVWDLFGIYFYNHVDLRRILTDYGFVGFPLRKDFPLSGFKEIRYDDNLKVIVSENLKLMQDFRVFSFINPWIK